MSADAFIEFLDDDTVSAVEVESPTSLELYIEAETHVDEVETGDFLEILDLRGPTGKQGPPGPEGPVGDISTALDALNSHINSPTPHPAYDVDMPDLATIWLNRIA